MDEKKHVGRPTNEEVANRKKKKVIKYSLITIVSILLVGGIALFLNRDNIDFSSLMGASIFKTYKYVVNDYDEPYYGYLDDGNKYKPEYESYILQTGKSKELQQFKDTLKTSCKVSNSRYASCNMTSMGIIITAKKKGNVSIKVTGENKKGKKITKTIRVKIGNDFRAPICKVSAGPLKTVKKGSTLEFTVSCNENVTLNDYYGDENDFGMSAYMGIFNSWDKTNKNCENFDNKAVYYNLLKEIKKIDNKTYKISYIVSPDLCSGNNYRFYITDFVFKDSSGNLSQGNLYSSYFSIK